MPEGQGSEHQTGPVEMTVPARSEHLRVLRLVTASFAASLELDIDQLDDLRIAIDELCGLLIEHAPPEAVLRLTLVGQTRRLEAAGSILGGGASAAVDPISQLILDGLDISWTKEEMGSFCVIAPRPVA